MTAAPASATLHRELGLLDAVGIGFGAIIGAGIFVVTGVAANIAGPSLVVSLLVAAVAATFNALSSAQLAARYPQSGGTYEYGYQLLGPWPGFVAGWMFLASKIAAAGVVAIGLGAYATMLVPGVNPRVLAVGAVVFFTILNYVGVQRTSKVNLVIVSISISSLLLLVAVGITSFRSAHFSPFAPGGLRGVFDGAAILFFAYTGYARIATLGEEVREPHRTIPRAVMVTMACSTLLYTAVAVVTIGVVGAPAMAITGAPLGVAAAKAAGPMIATLIAVGAVAAMFGVILSQILGMSRMAFAMARRDDLPRLLAAVHQRYGVPHRAVVMVGLGAGIIAATGTLRGVAAAASFAILVYYAIANWAALRLPPADRRYHPFIPASGLLACVLLACALSIGIIVGGLLILTAGIAVRVAMKWLRCHPVRLRSRHERY